MEATGVASDREPVDAVYTWVDGEDPDLRARLRRWRRGPVDAHGAGERRFRDNGELRHSLRSLERHASWIRRVHVVHAGSPPAWLDTSHPDIRMVRHEEIFPDPSVLPTFNSWAIESCLHRIPGLSRRFLYLNDDFLLARDTPRSWFEPTDGLPRFYFERIPIRLREGSPNVTDQALVHTLGLQPWKGPHRSPALVPSRTGWRRFLGLQPGRHKTAHVPQLYDREVIAGLEASFPREFRATRGHRFRAPDDLCLNTLYAYSGLARKRHEAVLLRFESPDFLFVMLRDDPGRTRGALDRLERERPRFVCVNDDVASGDPDAPALLAWKACMERCWPGPSRFERRDAR